MVKLADQLISDCGVSTCPCVDRAGVMRGKIVKIDTVHHFRKGAYSYSAEVGLDEGVYSSPCLAEVECS